MARRVVTVSDTAQLPPVVLAKIGETYISRIEANTIIDTRVQFAIDNLTTVAPVANKVPRFDEDGMTQVNPGTLPEHPATLGQLDDRIPADGIPLATQLAPGLMSLSDKSKLDSTHPRKPFPWGAKFSTLEPEVVYYHNALTYPEGADLSEFPPLIHLYDQIYGIQVPFEVIASEIFAGEFKVRTYVVTGPLMLHVGAMVANVPIQDPYPDLTQNLWYDLYMAAENASLLAGATSSNINGTLVKRDSAGRFSVGTPTATSHAVPKVYADDASKLSSGTVPYARLPLATAINPGAMSAAHYSKLLSSTFANNPSTMVERDVYGRFKVSSPLSATEVANKQYVDDLKVVDVATNMSVYGTRIESDISSPLRFALIDDRVLFLAGTVTAIGATTTSVNNGGTVIPSAFRPPSGGRNQFTITEENAGAFSQKLAYVNSIGNITLVEGTIVGAKYHFDNVVLTRAI